MLDVHSPHETPHTWKDFFIHIITICVGLLIAIALEQAVEALHHHHQRRELEHNLREEARKNLILIDIDKRGFDTYIPWLTMRVNQIAALRAAHGNGAAHRNRAAHVKLPPRDLPAPTAQRFWAPDPPSWDTAKESGLLVLLPPNEAAMFNLVYAQQEIMTTSRSAFFDARTAQTTFEQRFSDDPAGPPHPDATRMTPADLDQYETLVIANLNAVREFRLTTKLADEVTLAARNGATSDEELFRMMGGRPGEISTPSTTH